MRVHTIGFTQKSAKEFFELLRSSGAQRVVDVRLHNASQLAGFAKRDDLAYFVRELCGMDYVHLPILSPTEDMFTEYRKGGRDWERYARRFRRLIRDRKIEDEVPREVIDGACLLCSEAEPDHCHRRLVAEYLQERWGDLEIVHLV